ncbi:MAG: general stress protein [Mesorhizobium sp.]
MRLCLAAVADRWLLFAIWDISFLMKMQRPKRCFVRPPASRNITLRNGRKGHWLVCTRRMKRLERKKPRRRTMPQGGSHEQHVKAGQQSHKNDENRGRQQQAEDRNRGQQDGHRGGSGNFAEDRQRASEAGRKGGQH